MKFHTDDHFVIGHNHVLACKPCQDHALSGVRGSVAYAIVSDGCSTGGHTDVGARIVSFSTAAAIRAQPVETFKNSDASELINDQQLTILRNTQKGLYLATRDLLATCAYVVVSPENGFINVRGDGVFAVVDKAGIINLHRLDWANNMPSYPAYAADQYESFIAAQGGQHSFGLTHQVWQRGPDGDHLVTEFKHVVGKGIMGAGYRFSPGEISYAGVFSDGVTQVDGMDWKDVTCQLLAFKSTEGVFAKRRMNAFIKAAQKTGKGPLDDIAIAVVRVEHEEGEV